MNCPHCNSENVNTFGYCTSCGKPLQTLEGAGVPPPSPPDIAARPGGVLWLLATVPVALLALVAAVLGAHNDTKSDFEAIGYVIGALLVAIGVPFLIAYLVAGRKKVRRPRRFAAIFCCIGLTFAIGNLVGNLGSLTPETPEQMSARLMREAAGTQPVHSSPFSGKRKLEDALRGQYKKIIELNKSYMEKVHGLDTSLLKDLNSARSFVDPAVGEAALQQMHATYAVDAEQEVKMGQILSDLRDALRSTASSESERQEMEKGFDQGMKEVSARRSVAITAEKAWVEALDDEYAYARAHQANLHEKDGRVVIQGHEIVLEFNQRLRKQEELRKEFVRLEQEFTRYQDGLMRKTGLKPEDMGR
jgi:hypothetical protein